MPQARLAAHVAIVMDGNGRRPKARILPRTEGHVRGETSLFDVIEGGHRNLELSDSAASFGNCRRRGTEKERAEGNFPLRATAVGGLKAR
jgi:undecaprenyl diphosphate synthase